MCQLVKDVGLFHVYMSLLLQPAAICPVKPVGSLFVGPPGEEEREQNDLLIELLLLFCPSITCTFHQVLSFCTQAAVGQVPD